MSTSLVKTKVITYITNLNNEMLVLSHPDFPVIGLQVPGGTVESDEMFENAALREAREETGLTHLKLIKKLGTQKYFHPEKNETHLRHYFHLLCEEQTPETWIHYEEFPSNGQLERIKFELFWMPMNQPIILEADLGFFLKTLV